MLPFLHITYDLPSLHILRREGAHFVKLQMFLYFELQLQYLCPPPPTNQLRLFSAAHLESVEAGGQLYLYSSGHPNGPVFMELAHQAGIFRAEIFLPLS